MQIVVVAVVIKDKQVLLIRRVHKEPGLDWCCPGGRVEAGETEEHALIREVVEETNCTIKPIRKIGDMIHPLRSDMLLSYWHCDHVSGDTKVMEPHKHEVVGWYPLEDAKGLIERDWNPFIEELFLAYR